MNQRPALALGATASLVFFFHPLAHGAVLTCGNIDNAQTTVENYGKMVDNGAPLPMIAGIWMTPAYVSTAILKAREGGGEIRLGNASLTEITRVTNPISTAVVSMTNGYGLNLSATQTFSPQGGWSHERTNNYSSMGNVTESPAMNYNNYSRIIINNANTYAPQLRHLAYSHVSTTRFTMDIPEIDTESYTSTRIFDLHLYYRMSLGNSDTTYNGRPSGDYTYLYERMGACELQPIQLSITTTETVNYGTVRNDATPIVRNININITSGKQTPTGTVTFTSPSSSPGGRMTLNGGVVTLKNRTDNQEILLGTPVAITTRDMTIESELDPAGATPGEATAYLNVTMAVN